MRRLSPECGASLGAVTFQSYCGKYEIKGDRVMHHVEVSLNPNDTGEVLRTLYPL